MQDTDRMTAALRIQQVLAPANYSWRFSIIVIVNQTNGKHHRYRCGNVVCVSSDIFPINAFFFLFTLCRWWYEITSTQSIPLENFEPKRSDDSNVYLLPWSKTSAAHNSLAIVNIFFLNVTFPVIPGHGVWPLDNTTVRAIRPLVWPRGGANRLRWLS